MNFIINCAKGMALGAGAILPGISSGVLCVIFCIYEKLLDSFLNFFSDIRKNSKFLLPILIGVFIGALLFSNVLNYFLSSFPIQTKSIFIGLILGGIPSLIKEANKKGAFKIHYLIYTFLALIIGLGSTFLENYISVSTNMNFDFWYLVLCGFLMSIGVVVPGVSSTIILMLLGCYSVYIGSVSSLYLPVLIPMGIGLLTGSVVFMKLTKFLLNNYYGATFFSILGFTLGSISVLFPVVDFGLSGLICFFCILLGFFAFQFFKE